MGLAKAVLRGKFKTIQSYLKKQNKTKKHWIDNLNLHLKQLEKEQKENKICRRKEIIKSLSRNKWKWNERNNSKD